jgi:hypothetical protein
MSYWAHGAISGCWYVTGHCTDYREKRTNNLLSFNLFIAFVWFLLVCPQYTQWIMHIVLLLACAVGASRQLSNDFSIFKIGNLLMCYNVYNVFNLFYYACYSC